MSAPQFTIATPVYNAAGTVARTLDALAAQRASFEHLVYDGGSADATPSIVASYEGRYPVRLIRGANEGVYGNVANAFREARGSWMGWINGDDFYLPWTLAVVGHVFATRPEVQWLTGIPNWYWERDGTSQANAFAPVYHRSLIRRGWHRRTGLGYLQQESMFWRRSLYEAAQGEVVLRRHRYAADYHLWRAFAEHTELATVSAVLATFSYRPGQFSQVCSEPYDRDAGIEPGARDWSAWGRLFNRVNALIYRRRVILPQDFDRAPSPPA